MGPYIVCLVTIDDPAKAAKIAQILVERKLAACVNIIPEIQSIYSWKGQICNEKERLMIIKTRADLFSELQKTVKALHPYEVPEIIAVDIKEGLPEYMQWINDSTVTAP